MRCEVMIHDGAEEKVVIYAKKETPLVEEIRKLVEQWHTELLGYGEDEVVRLNPPDIQYVAVQGGRVWAVCQNRRYLLKERLYTLEEKLPEYFVKINQSCLANLKKTHRFDTSVSGTLKICFQNGDVDYVSRRQLRSVKERVGI